MMDDDCGRSPASQGRDATPSEPSQSSLVSGKAGIPSAVRVWTTRPTSGGVMLETDVRPLRDIVADEMSKRLAWDDRADPYALADSALAVPLVAAALEHLRVASAIEARSDATGTGAAEGESAVGNAETPKPHPSTPSSEER